MRRSIAHYIFAFIIFSIASIYLTYPLIFHLGNLTTGWGDELLIAWIHNWDSYSLLHHPLHIFQGNIFYPFTDTLAFSDVFITSSLVAAVPVSLIGQPIAANNVTLISSLTLVGFSFYLLVFSLTKQKIPAFLSGMLVIFSPVMLDKTVHLQMLSLEWVIFSLVFFIRFLKGFRVKDLLFSAFFFLLQMYNSFLPAYFLLFVYESILFFGILTKKIHQEDLFKWRVVLVAIVTVLLSLPIIIPYYHVSSQYQFVRDIHEAVHLALQPEDLLNASTFSRAYTITALLPFNNPANYKAYTEFKPGFLGVVFSLLSLIVLYKFIFQFKKNNYLFNAFVTVGLTGLILSLGPVLHFNRQTIHHPFLIPLPYSIFYYLLPGFQGFRNSFRWEMLFVLAFAVAIGIALSEILPEEDNRKKIIISGILFFGIIGEFNFPMHFVPVKQVRDFPKVYTWLKNTPLNVASIEMPIYNWNMYPYAGQELFRDYFASYHLHPIVNGASGFSPPPWQELVVRIMQTFPDQDSLTLIKKLGVQYIIVHKVEYDALNQHTFRIGKTTIPSGIAVLKALQVNKHLQEIQSFQNDYVFVIKR